MKKNKKESLKKQKIQRITITKGGESLNMIMAFVTHRKSNETNISHKLKYLNIEDDDKRLRDK